ncbi:MAG: recombinase family protein [Litoreibacter sp.]
MIRQRCAIYTRKSTEEGLEQDFNSLDAQREACAAYILSQKHEGWSELSDRYDDGGFSGGSMERPALKQLLADVQAGRVDVIVVYKVDRLTRSLMDFAKMVESFDLAGVSFVSVTQAFNTTNSMGRLTLNVLLSFAQFEREVTAERIRDKVAASKRKGMWMGGAVPIGYDVREKALVVNPVEAAAIKIIFAEYLEVGSVRRLTQRLDTLDIVSKRRTDRHGRVTGGKAFSRGSLYNILRNPIYIGKVRHKDELYDGLHDAILDALDWRAAQELLADHGGRKITTERRHTGRVLNGLLFDEIGRPMCPTYASKTVQRIGTHSSKRYWYYASKKSHDNVDVKVRRFPADAIEEVVRAAVVAQLTDSVWLADALSKQKVGAAETAMLLTKFGAAPAKASKASSTTDDDGWIRSLLKRVDLAKGTMCVTLDLATLASEPNSGSTIHLQFELPFTLHQNGRAKPIMIAAAGRTSQRDPDLIMLVADAKRWMAELVDGRAASVQEITKREGLRSGAVSRVLPLAYLAPDISAAILEGHQPASLSAKHLRDQKILPLDWSEQRRVFGFPCI